MFTHSRREDARLVTVGVVKIEKIYWSGLNQLR